MRRQDISTREHISCVERANVSVDDVDVAPAEKRKIGDVPLVDVCETRPQIAELVRSGRIERNAETRSDQCLVVLETQMNVVDVVGLVLRFAAICIESPTHARIPLATFDEQIDPLRPSAEIENEHDQPWLHLVIILPQSCNPNGQACPSISPTFRCVPFRKSRALRRRPLSVCSSETRKAVPSPQAMISRSPRAAMIWPGVNTSCSIHSGVAFQIISRCDLKLV